jgi:hypothetical protein
MEIIIGMEIHFFLLYQKTEELLYIGGGADVALGIISLHHNMLLLYLLLGIRLLPISKLHLQQFFDIEAVAGNRMPLQPFG